MEGAAVDRDDDRDYDSEHEYERRRRQGDRQADTVRYTRAGFERDYNAQPDRLEMPDDRIGRYRPDGSWSGDADRWRRPPNRRFVADGNDSERWDSTPYRSTRDVDDRKRRADYVGNWGYRARGDRFPGDTRDVTPGWRSYGPRQGEAFTQRAWSEPGPFAGRGPRGYRRSDERINEEVSQSLTDHGEIDASDVDVSVDQGEVTLEGTVSSRYEKRLAEDLAADVSGVHDVHNRLRVRREQREWRQNRYDDRDAHDRRIPGRDRVSTAPPAASGRGRELAWQVRQGLQVFGPEDDNIGIVKEIDDNGFLVNRTFRKDLYVPFEVLREVNVDRVVLSVEAGEIEDQDWDEAPAPDESDD
jgi:hypothetical protein